MSRIIKHSPSDTSRHIGLLAPEVCTKGGVQSFMVRVAEVIGGIDGGGEAINGYCLSLNDNTESLRRHTALPARLHVWGANRSKIHFIAHILLSVPRFDVLIVGHIGLAPVACVLKMMGRLSSYYVILHGIEAWQRLSFLDRLALSGATKVLTTTRYTAERCGTLNTISPDLFQVVPLCSDERRVEPSPDLGLQGDIKLLSVGRQDAAERYKGFESLFEALKLLKPCLPGVHLNIIGSGDDQPRLKDIAKELGVESQVTFWGVVSDEDLAAAYKDCDIFVMPSKNEGFGIVFLEAMRWGKPCIGGNHGGTPEVIEHGKSGFLVEYGDTEGLADFIHRLSENSGLRHEMGLRGRTLAAEKFSRRNFQRNYQKLLIPDIIR